ncbi:hypothetical protein [Rhodocaloribacter sp.]
MAVSSMPAPAPTAGRTVWKAAKHLALAATVVLVAALIVRPEAALKVLWNGIIPLLPASFLLTPALWRAVCPLATLNEVTNVHSARRPSPSFFSFAGPAGIVLLGALVPARHFLFNANGPALAGVIVGVGGAALVLGGLFAVRSGFCNGICPVLPVERLYGQHPLLGVRNPRCATCSLCTETGCLDLVPKKSVRLALGPGYHSHAWLKTGFGVFAAAFPGFVVGYYTSADGGLAEAGRVYVHVFLWAAGSYGATALVVRLFRVRAETALPVLAAAAAGLYYLFAAPLITAAFGLSEPWVWGMRGAALALVAVWLGRALLRVRRKPVRSIATRPVPVDPPEMIRRKGAP